VAKPLTAKQRARLKERDRLAAKAKEFFEKRNSPEMLAAWKKKLAIEREIFGDVNAEVADSLVRLAWMHEVGNDFQAAAKARQEVVIIRTKLHGARDWRVTDAKLDLEELKVRAGLSLEDRQRLDQATILKDKVEGLDNEGRFIAALPLAERVANTYCQILGKENRQYASSLNKLGLLYQDMGDYPKALPLFEKARDLAKKHLTENHPDYATSLNNLAGLYRDMGDYPKALPLFQKVRDLRRKLLTENHPHYAGSLNNLALLYKDMGNYQKALALYEKARDLSKKLLTENHPHYALSLNNLGLLYQAMGDYPKALPLLEQARDLSKKLLTENHPHYALCLNNLALLYQAMGDYPKALPLFEKARDLTKKRLTENHPQYVVSLANLAVLYQAMGDYPKALPLFEKARDLTKKLLTENHPDYADSLNNLAVLHMAMGDYLKALPLYEKARDLYKKLLTKNHPLYVASLNNLAALHRDMGDYPKALPLFEKARDLRRKLLTENHPLYADSLNNLAVLYKVMGDYQKALPLLEKACELDNKFLTENHPEYAKSLNNLALLYQAMGDYLKALPVLEKARDLAKKLLTENHPDCATSLHHLAVLLYCLKKPKEAAPLAQRALTIKKAFLDNTFTAQSYRQRLDFLQHLKGFLDIFLTVSVEADVPCGRLYDQVLAWKGALALRQAEEHLAHDHPSLQRVLDDLRQVRASLAYLARKPAATSDQQANWLKRFAALERDKEKLETTLAQKSADFRRSLQLRKASTQEVQKVLPAGTALVDFVRYTHFTSLPIGKGLLVPEDRLLAFVLRPKQQAVLLHLGPIKPIEKAIQGWRKDVAQNQALDKLGSDVARRLWRPLRRYVANAHTVLISPDGPVCSLPFAALPGKRAGTYLVEELAIGYVTSGRQLLELDAAKNGRRGRGLLTVGGLAYGKASPSSPATADLWKDLPGTLLESERVARIFREAFPRAGTPRQLQGEAVDAAALKRELPPADKAPRRRFLHLATHGYFEAPAPYHPGRGVPSGDATFGMWRDYYTYGRNPLVRSGLVLAGANHSAAQGILSAEEVADLDLRGVELTVLSACDTGLGKEAAGEGVLGLQRAFQASGARSLLISLWSVNDAATSVLMEEFYENLWLKGMPKLKALQQAQRTVLHNPARVAQRARKLRELLAKRGVSEASLAARGIGKQAGDLPQGGKVQKRSHPALWAAFVLSGDGK
jgi:tetratricopeptide (TPR) repeat protein